MVLATSISSAQGQSHQRGRGQSPWWTNPKVQEQLALSNDQIGQISGIYEKTREARQKASVKQRQAYRELVVGLGNDGISDQEIGQRLEDVEEAMSESTRATVDLWVQLRGVLSAEQWRELPKASPRTLRLGGMLTRGVERVQVEGDQESD